MGATQHMEKLSCVILTLQGFMAYESLSLSLVVNLFLKKPFWNSFWKYATVELLLGHSSTF